MKINAELIVKFRKERSWSQDELAIASGLNLRTVQRVEKYGLASLQTKKALAAAFEIDTQDLENEDMSMKEDMSLKSCPVCGSNKIFRYKEYFQGPGAQMGDTLFPKLGGTFSIAKVCPTVCSGCGHVRIFVSEEARKKLKSSKHWNLVDAE
jgi:DNA-binding XRE family transcriptional regulator